MNGWLSIALAALILSALPTRAAADSISPLLVEIRELQAGIFGVTRKIPAALPGYYQPEVVMPDGCERLSPPQRAGSLSKEIYKCPDGLRGRAVAIGYPGPNPSVATALRLSLQSGDRLSTLLGPDESSWQVPEIGTWGGVARNYTLLGIGHILQSMDHLLFVVCLLWIAGDLRRVLMTITGFTAAHSVTLILSALNLVQAPVTAVEASIALSILFLAREIAVGRSDTLTWRYPIVISSGFGLLHGFGFASALSRIGLPQQELVTGLLFFNVGVELGQLAFILFVLAMLRSFRLMQIEWPRVVEERVPVYAVGVASAVWALRGVFTVLGARM